jgi:tryptophan-rich sensory protein
MRPNMIKNIAISASPFLASLPFTVLDVNRFDDDNEKALWQPPGYVFGIVWPLLYASLFYMNYSIFTNSKLSESFKNLIARDTLIEAGLQGIWLYIFRFNEKVNGRSGNQYLFGIITLLTLLVFGMYRITTLLLNSETNRYLYNYLPYFIWISFASILGFQLYMGITKK